MPPIKRHLRVDAYHQRRDYKSKRRGISEKVPIRLDGITHAATLVGNVTIIQNAYATLSQTWEGNENIRARGITIELEAVSGLEQPPTNRLADQGWELLNERECADAPPTILQTWFVPDGKLSVISDLLNDYLTKTRTRKGVTQPLYRPFVDSIEKIGQASAEQLWTEPDRPFPVQETRWFEVWLRAGESEATRKAILNQFRLLAPTVGLRIGEGVIELPEHSVVACYGPGSGFTGDLALLNCVAEIRLGRDYADFFEALPSTEQVNFINDLIGRTTKRPGNLPILSVLDTGINRGHPALEPFVAPTAARTIRTDWGTADDDNHGTLLSGLCLYGDLSQALGATGTIQIPFDLESAKIVPPPALRGTDEKLAGYYTAQGVALSEITEPVRRRIWCMSTTMSGPNKPQPSSWSAQLDSLAVGSDNGGTTQRLFCISGGNVPQEDWVTYPDSNTAHHVQNPGQSWNALCVGSCTHFDQIRPANSQYTAVAPRGCISPSNSTSHSWEDIWPNKPDVVFEGGNAGYERASNSTLELPELLPLSTAADFRTNPLCTFGGTSAAVAGVARIAGQIAAEYPEFRVETIRALIVHSAQWTREMENSIPAGLTGSDRIRYLLRTAGYGVPSFSRAAETVANRATLIAECELQPFKDNNGEISFNEMHLHSLPWPIAELQRHSQETIRLRVTLSYFIEPNPGNRGYTSTYSYPGCQLRFKVSSPGQTERDLEAAVSKIAADNMTAAGRTVVLGSSDGWRIGNHRNRGSVHSDLWQGSCADLLSMRHIAVFPVTGWWRTRPSRNKGNEKIRYSLIATIESTNPDLDIATEIETVIASRIAV